jgi:ketosteroid isomerase-like protein
LKRHGWIAAVLFLAISAAARAEELPSIKLPAAIDRVLRDYERAWQSHDAKALVELFTEDGFVLANGRPPVRGREEIRAAYAKAGGPLALRALASSTEGSVGYIIGVYGHGDGVDAGKFILALRRVRERWQIAADMDNSNQRSQP